MLRKHATITPQVLPAGDYWFYMAGDGSNLMQGTGHYVDDFFYYGSDGNPDLEEGHSQWGEWGCFLYHRGGPCRFCALLHRILFTHG